MPPPPSKVAPNRGISPLLDQVILKLLAKKRDDRYKDTADLRADLARLMRGETGEAVSAPAAPPPVTVAPTQAPRSAPSTDRVAVMTAPGEKKGVGKGTILLVAGLVLAVAAAVVAILLFVVK